MCESVRVLVASRSLFGLESEEKKEFGGAGLLG